MTPSADHNRHHPTALRLAAQCLKWIAGFALGFAAGPARADFFLHHWENHHQDTHRALLSAEAHYFATTQDYDGNGNLLIPTGLQKYTRIQTDLLAEYGIWSRLSAFARLSFARAQLDHDTLAGTSFGPTDQTLGLNVRVHEFATSSSHPSGKGRGVAIDAQAQVDFPLYDNKALQTNGPGLGDGTVDITGGAFLTVPLLTTRDSWLLLTGGGGFTWRSSSFSSAIPWSLAASFSPMEEGVFGGVAILGLQSLRNDPRAASISATSSALSAATGGSFIGNAVNPSVINARGQFGYMFSPIVGLSATVSTSFWGQAAPEGWNFGFGLQARLGAPSRKSPLDLSPRDYGKSNQGLITYSMEAHVTRTNDRLNLVKLDKGSQEGVEVGQIFDIFSVKKDGTIHMAVARGKITAVQPSESALTVQEYFKEVWIDEGFIAKRPLP
jgi:hypothetical protein